MLQRDGDRQQLVRRRFAPRHPPIHGVIRPTYAGVFDLDRGGYDHARDVVLNWIRTHPTVETLVGIVNEDEFDYNLMAQEGLLAQAVTSSDGSTTVVRLQHRERHSGRYDPARNWRTDVTIERDEESASIATRQWFAGVASDERKCSPPRFIKDLWHEKALSDALVLEDEFWNIEFDQEVDEIIELIKDEDRALPIVLMADGCPLDPQRVAQDSIGLAHVCRLPNNLRLRLNQALESEQELVHGAVRTFYPLVAGRPLLAPAARFETIVEWRFNDRVGPSAFGPWLHQEIGRAVVARLLNDAAHKTFEEISVAVIQSKRAELETHTEDATALREALGLLEDQQKLMIVEYQQLKEQLEETTSRAQQYLDVKADAEQRLRDEVKRNQRLQFDKKTLQDALNAKAESGPIVWDAVAVERLITEQPAPETIFDAVETAERLFELHGARVRVSDEAKEGAMEALSFKRPADVQAALIRLGFRWDDMRKSGRRLDDAGQDGIHFPCSMFESETTMRLYGGQRWVRMDGTSVVLQKHVKLGAGGKDESARIYFGDKDGEILIGHVGRHLDVAGTQ